ncbi:hypothetical protein ACFQFQ_29875 [Sulfitobacter porphyrae]|uniref:Uncharacterized protein n=1 Tax=Sulfitobacter porphyrae TaxID=1246864 RepID=A0ABW2BAR3_9RHOB
MGHSIHETIDLGFGRIANVTRDGVKTVPLTFERGIEAQTHRICTAQNDVMPQLLLGQIAALRNSVSDKQRRTEHRDDESCCNPEKARGKGFFCNLRILRFLFSKRLWKRRWPPSEREFFTQWDSIEDRSMVHRKHGI